MAGIHGMLLGAGGLKKINLVIAVNTTDYNIKTAALAAGWDGSAPADIVVTVNSGVYVGSTSNSTPGLDTGTGFPASGKLSLNNLGYILGKGGNANGGAGGPAFLAQVPIAVDNASGVIGGGGGGGGYGQQMQGKFDKSAYRYGGGGGGGGGAGYSVSSGGGINGGTSADYDPVYNTSGSGGSATAGGAGGGAGIAKFSGPSSYWVSGGSGGAGGGLGASGAGGGAGWVGGYITSPGVASAASSGGAGGNCTVSGSNANITWVNTGTRYGAIG
jgi:hypothetical protein